MQLDIRHDEDSNRFYADLGEPGQRAVLSYRPAGDGVLDFHSTLVPPQQRGNGIGRRIVLHALRWARDNDFKVVPSCPFVDGVIQDNPDYQDVVAGATAP
ncbi:MAG TPA: GNAT family N-acetyltransferase [Thermoanaerobaculia bacterium]|nr:GNAT family N-acetyltransferase [Thermoanaerobaculia bacterium]